MACNDISKRSAKIILGISIFVLILSVGLIFVFNVVYEILLKDYIALRKGSLVTKIWEDIPLPIFEKLYFFNITNKESFLKGLEPLNVTEVGPYTYRSRWVKDHLKWNTNHTVSYQETRTYHFVPEMSVGSEDDRIYTLNGPLIIGASIVPDSLRIYFDYYCLLAHEKLIIRKSIRELVYEGYDDSIIKKAYFLHLDLPYKEGKFAWLYGKNASNDGLFTVFTGVDDETKTDIINNWNGIQKLNFWTNDTCNMINGTSIETGPPIKKHQESYTFYQSFFCRSITFNYTRDVEHYNILAKRFNPTHQIFANSTENPDNYCFEVNQEHPSGILDISHCQFGAPVFVSFPHFYLADPFYTNSINGLNPSEEKHSSHIDVEPVTGVSIDINLRFQINIEIKKLKNFYLFENASAGIFPVFWADLSYKFDDDLANYLKRNVRDPKTIGYIFFGALHFMSWIGVIISAVILGNYKTKEDENLLITSNEQKTPLLSSSNSSKQGHGSITKECFDNNARVQSSNAILTSDSSENFITSLGESVSETTVVASVTTVQILEKS